MKPWHWLLITLAALAVAFAAGRFSTPTKVVEVESKKSQEQIHALSEQLESAKRHTVKRTVIKFTPAGKPVEKTVTEDTHVDRFTDTRAQVDSVKIVEVVKRVEVTKSGPKWFAGPVVVFVPSAPPGQQFGAGIVVGRHILGPVAGSISVTVPVHKPVSVPSFGLSLTVGF